VAVEISIVGHHPADPGDVLLIEQEPDALPVPEGIGRAQQTRQRRALPGESRLLRREPPLQVGQGPRLLLVHGGELMVRTGQVGDVPLAPGELLHQGLPGGAALAQVLLQGLHLPVDLRQRPPALLQGSLVLGGRRSGRAQQGGEEDGAGPGRHGSAGWKRIRDCPCISAGWAMPMIASMVGAMSHRAPPSIKRAGRGPT
jgi:hypothetical protein